MEIADDTFEIPKKGKNVSIAFRQFARTTFNLSPPHAIGPQQQHGIMAMSIGTKTAGQKGENRMRNRDANLGARIKLPRR